MEFTVDDVLNWGPCDAYNRDKLTRLFDGKDCCNEFDVINARIPAESKQWVLGHIAPYLDDFEIPWYINHLGIQPDDSVVELITHGTCSTKVSNGQSLTHVTLSGNITRLFVMNNPKLINLNIPDSVRELTVVNNPQLVELKLHEGIKRLWVINNDSLSKMRIPSSVVDLAVVNNFLLSDFDIPENTKNAWVQCNNMELVQ